MKSDSVKLLQDIVMPFARLAEEEISVSLPFWQKRDIAKGNFYNKQNVVCKELGIVIKGIFQVYYYDPETD